eukprot:13277-Heterococcus_DN1.PRE.2
MLTWRDEALETLRSQSQEACAQPALERWATGCVSEENEVSYMMMSTPILTEKFIDHQKQTFSEERRLEEHINSGATHKHGRNVLVQVACRAAQRTAATAVGSSPNFFHKQAVEESSAMRDSSPT